MEYNFNYEYRGQAVVFANEFRGQGTLERAGCIRDITMMQELFERLDFLVTVYKDFSANGMLDKMNRVSQDNINYKSDCLVVVISTHGNEVKERKIGHTHTTTAIDRWHNAVYGNDCSVVYVDQILKIFQESISLKNKPKLIFIQACRSRNINELTVEDFVRKNVYDHGHTIEVVKGTSSNRGSIWEPDTPDDGPVLPLHAVYTCDLNSSVDNIYDCVERDPDEWKRDVTTSTLTDLPEPQLAGDPADNTVVDTPQSPGITAVDAVGFQGGMIPQSSDVKETLSENTTERGATGDVPEGDSTLPHALRDMALGEDASPFRDEEDAHGGQSRSLLPAEPLDLSHTFCPEDFLVMCPIMPGKTAFRDSQNGSYMLQYLHKPDNLSLLLNGYNILQYVTRVCKDMSKYEYMPDVNKLSFEKQKSLFLQSIRPLSKSENRTMLQSVLGDLPGESTLTEQVLKHYFGNIKETDTDKVGRMKNILNRILPFKTTGCCVHRLRANVAFQPKKQKTKMANAVNYIRETNV